MYVHKLNLGKVYNKHKFCTMFGTGSFIYSRKGRCQNGVNSAGEARANPGDYIYQLSWHVAYPKRRYTLSNNSPPLPPYCPPTFFKRPFNFVGILPPPLSHLPLQFFLNGFSHFSFCHKCCWRDILISFDIQCEWKKSLE